MIYVLVLLYGTVGGEVGKSETVELAIFPTAEACTAAAHKFDSLLHTSYGNKILAIATCKTVPAP